MSRYIKFNRKPKTANLDGLMVVNSDEAFDKQKQRFKSGVFGIVDKELPFISKIVVQRDGNKRRSFVQDVTELPDVAKERIMAFFDVPENKNREKCYLVERELYDEVRGKKVFDEKAATTSYSKQTNKTSQRKVDF